MTETPQLSGKDLARQALAAYKATARTAPAPGPTRAKRKRVTRQSGGRDPITLATAITALGADLPLDTGVAGGNLLNQWPELCPQFAGRVEPAAYDEQTGRLDLRPASHAYAAQLRLLGGQLAKQVNDKLGRPVVRSIRVLPVGSVSGTDTTSMPPTPTDKPAPAPVKTLDTASAGYRHVLALALENKSSPHSANPYEEEARQRQIAAARANRLPETEHTEAQWVQDDAEQKAGPRPGSLEASIAAAIARKRREAVGLAEPRRAFDVA